MAVPTTLFLPRFGEEIFCNVGTVVKRIKLYNELIANVI